MIAPVVTQADWDAMAEYDAVNPYAPDSDFVAVFAAHRTAAEAAFRQELERRFWSIVDPNSVPSDMWDALDRLASAYRARAKAAEQGEG